MESIVAKGLLLLLGFLGIVYAYILIVIGDDDEEE